MKQILHVNGFVLQWQDTDKFSYADPPTGAVILAATDDEWARQDELKWVRNGRLTDIAPEPPAPTLDDLQAAKIAEINTAFTLAAQALTNGYPEAERLTWPAQQAEALAWGADHNTPTPYLDGLAAARGIDPDDMREKTLTQTQLFMAASQQLVGTRQRLRDLVHDAQTPEALDTINWPA